MAPDFDPQHYYGKMAREETFTEAEISDLVRIAVHYRNLAAHLAECHAATAESLPASASKSVRGRHANICDTAAKGLRGDSSGIRHPGRVEAAIGRCEKTSREQNSAIQAHDAKVAAQRAIKAKAKKS